MSGRSSKRMRRAMRGVMGEGIDRLWSGLAALPFRARAVLALRMLRGQAVDGNRIEKGGER